MVQNKSTNFFNTYRTLLKQYILCCTPIIIKQKNMIYLLNNTNAKQSTIFFKKYNFSIQSIKIFLKSQKQLPLHFLPLRL